MRIDAHQHFWCYTPEEYGWISNRMGQLRRDFLPADLKPLLHEAKVDGSVAVQARQSLLETHWLLELARNHPEIKAVVGWADIRSNDFAWTVNLLRSERKLRGLRHVVQDEPAGFLDGAAFNRGISLLKSTSLVYEVLVYAHQLPEAIRLVDRHPEQAFVLDHAGKPDIAGDGYDAWVPALRELAKRDNVTCKLSGLVTEADWATWNGATLQPYFDAVLEAFHPARLMVGSDWPVVTLASSYSRWWDTVEDWLLPLSADERERIQGGTATAVYGLAPERRQTEGAIGA